MFQLFLPPALNAFKGKVLVSMTFNGAVLPFIFKYLDVPYKTFVFPICSTFGIPKFCNDRHCWECFGLAVFVLRLIHKDKG